MDGTINSTGTEQPGGMRRGMDWPKANSATPSCEAASTVISGFESPDMKFSLLLEDGQLYYHANYHTYIS